MLSIGTCATHERAEQRLRPQPVARLGSTAAIRNGTSAQELASAGVAHGLARISVGIKAWRDPVPGFEQALAIAA